jgi:hypothetical protein
MVILAMDWQTPALRAGIGGEEALVRGLREGGGGGADWPLSKKQKIR